MEPWPRPPQTSPGSRRSPDSAGAPDTAERRAREILADGDLARLLTAPREGREIERARQIFVNRNLRMSRIELVGFDMDYTLAIYHARRIEQLSFDMTLQRLVSERGYPEEIGGIQYDHGFVMRGLVVDKLNGNLIKMDRFGYVGRAYHGLKPLDPESWRRLYRHESINFKRGERYAQIDTLFALPEAYLYAGIIDQLEGQGLKVDYARLYEDIRECIDTVHRDNSLKQEIRKDIGRFIFRDPELGPALHKLRSGGKKLFLLTNSLWDYTDTVMGYLLDGVVPEYPSWRNYFDLLVTGAAKPAFFSEQRPFLELDIDGGEARPRGEAERLDRWKVYQGGNLAAFQRMTGFPAESVLYVGDHIFGDILRSKKTSAWRTCMVVQEIEDEINYTDARHETISALSEVELLLARLDDEVSARKTQLNLLERRLDRNGETGDGRARLEERRRLKQELERVRRALKESSALSEMLEEEVEAGFNRYWGLLFKEGNENSRFGEQVEQYACIYTSRVSNFLHYSPVQYYRSPRDLMPHERAGALSGKLSPLGSEGPPRGWPKE